MEKEQIREMLMGSLTEFQKNELKQLSGIGSEQHFLKAPQLADVRKNGVRIGWWVGTYKGVPTIQCTTDIQNWKDMIATYKPEIYIECGVANGGSLLYIHDLMKEYCTPIVCGIDVIDDRHILTKNESNIKFIMSDVLNENTVNEVKKIIDENGDKRCLIHFDDNHNATHVLQEMEVYCELFKKDDVIIVGDTWNEGWFDSPFRALVDFFHKNQEKYYYDKPMNEKMIMPCNWIFGILIKK